MYQLIIANKNYSSWSMRPWVPCLVDGAVRVWDSLAITEYLAERHAGVWPRDAVARAWARSVATRVRRPMVCRCRSW